MAFLDVRVAEEILPKVIDLMAAEYNWSAYRKKKEFEDAMVRRLSDHIFSGSTSHY